jgi:uncharacterized protein
MSASRSVLARTAVVAAVGLLVILIAGPMTAWRPGGPASAAATDPGSAIHGITVQGTGKVTLTPDLANITVAVQSQGSTAAKTQSQASAAMTKVIAAMKAKGVADKDLATAWLSLGPQYDYSGAQTLPRIIGYQANQSLSITVRKIDDTGPIIDAAVGAGANQVSGISFSVADPVAATAQARTAAIVDAKARAAALASAAGVAVGSPLEITETSAPAPTPVAYDRAALGAVAAPTTPVQLGTTDIEVDVTVTFAIG